MFGIPLGLFIFLCFIPPALIYAIVSVNGKKKKAVAACKQEINHFADEAMKAASGTFTLRDLRSIKNNYDKGIFKKALDQSYARDMLTVKEVSSTE